MIENKEIIFKWRTGEIHIWLHSVLDMSAAELKKFVAAADVNREEIKAEIAAFLHTIVDGRNENDIENKSLKKDIANGKKLLAVVEDRKLTKTEKTVMKIFRNDYPRAMCHAIFEDAGKYCACDGYRLLRFSEPLSSDIPVTYEKLNTAKAIGDPAAYSVALALPSASDLRKDIKIAKSGHCAAGHVHGEGTNYDFGYGLPMVNAAFLLDMLYALPDCKAYCQEGRPNAPVYFVSGENDGILLSVRKTQEYEPEPVEEPAPVEAPAPASEAETVPAAEPAEPAAVSQAEQAAPEAEDLSAEDRVEAVAQLVNDTVFKERYLELYEAEMITEDETKRALLLYSAAPMLPPHVQPVSNAVEIVVVNPAVIVSAEPAQAAVQGNQEDGAPAAVHSDCHCAGTIVSGPDMETVTGSDAVMVSGAFSVGLWSFPPGGCPEILPDILRLLSAHSAPAMASAAGYNDSS